KGVSGMNRSDYDKDKKCEEIVSQWMEENLFNKKSFLGTYYKNHDESLQKSGVDSYLKYPSLFKDDSYYAIDEKSATSYIRTDLEEENIPTFAFELDYKGQNGKRNEGWLFGNKYKKTEYYLISWIWANVSKNKNGFGEKEEVSKDNILKVKAYLICKRKIHKYLEGFKVTKENFMRISQKIRCSGNLKENINPMRYRKTPNVQFSKYIYEQPVNVIISQHDLGRMSIKTWEVMYNQNREF